MRRTVRLAEAHRRNKSRRHKDTIKADDTRTQQKQTTQGHNNKGDTVVPPLEGLMRGAQAFFISLAQVSLRPMVLLKTGWPGVESLSTT